MGRFKTPIDCTMNCAVMDSMDIISFQSMSCGWNELSFIPVIDDGDHLSHQSYAFCVYWNSLDWRLLFLFFEPLCYAAIDKKKEVLDGEWIISISFETISILQICKSKYFISYKVLLLRMACADRWANSNSGNHLYVYPIYTSLVF